MAAVGPGQEVAAAGLGQEVAAAGQGQEVAAAGEGQEVAAAGQGQVVAAAGQGQEVAAAGPIMWLSHGNNKEMCGFAMFELTHLRSLQICYCKMSPRMCRFAICRL